MFVAPWTPPVTAEASPNPTYGPDATASDDGGRTWTKPPPASASRLTQSLLDRHRILAAGSLGGHVCR